MGSLLENWPSYDPHNFSQLRPLILLILPKQFAGSIMDATLGGVERRLGLLGFNGKHFHEVMDISALFLAFGSEKITPATYHPTHNRTVPPPNQVISTEAIHILLRHIYKGTDGKLRPKRAASQHLTPEHGCKQPRCCLGDDSN